MFKKMLFCAAAGLLLLAQSACDNDKPQPTPSAQKGSTLITTTVVNPDGASGVCYMQLIDGLTGHYDNAKAVPAGFGAPPVVQGRDVFVLPDYMGNNKAEMRHYVYETNGTLQQRGTLALPAGAGRANRVQGERHKGLRFVPKHGTDLGVQSLDNAKKSPKSI